MAKCEWVDCDRYALKRGYCLRCYQRARSTGLIRKNTGKRSHPLYSIWFERKTRGSLCPAWAQDIYAFVAVVGERPSPTHLLRRCDNSRPYDETNWEWIAALKRQPGESKKAFDARKWADRRQRLPDYEGRRYLMRKYKITPEDYQAMLAAQGGTCATCGGTETLTHSTTNEIVALAVDHCKETGLVRGLLCFACNTTLGKVKHDTGHLRRMIAFLDDPPAPKVLGKRPGAPTAKHLAP